MDLDKYYEWYDCITTTMSLRGRGLSINTKEAWIKGIE